MAWTVRTEYGSLDFETLGELECAYRNGLVSPEDEVREERKQQWRRADSIPALRSSVAKTKSSGLPRPFLLSLAIGLALGVSSLICLAYGQFIFATVLAIALCVFLLKFTARAATPKRTFVRV